MDNDALTLFCNAHDAFMAKREYIASRTVYDSLSFFDRLRSRRPVDPIPGFTDDRLERLAIAAFQSLLPSMEYIGKDGERASAKAELSFDRMGRMNVSFYAAEKVSFFPAADKEGGTFSGECFELEGGRGLVHVYTHDNDRVVNERKRDYAYNYAISGRLSGEPYSSVYLELDQIRSCDRIRSISTDGVSGLKMIDVNLLSAFDEKLRGDDIGRTARYQMLSALERHVKVNSVEDYVRNRIELLSRFGIMARGNELEKMYQVLAYDIYSGALSDFDAVYVYDKERHRSMSLDKNLLLDSVFVHSLRQAELDNFRFMSIRSDVKYEAIENFVLNALNAGFEFPDIEKKVEEFRKKEKLGVEFKPSYEQLHIKAADTYMKIIAEQVDTAFGNGIREVAKIEVQSPGGVYDKTVQRVCDMQSAMDFLEQNNGVGPVKLNETGHLVHVNPFVIGAFVFTSGKEVSFEALSDLTVLSAVGLRDGYAKAFSDEFSKRIDISNQILPKSSSLAVDILAKDMFDTYNYLRKEHPMMASRFLLDSGVSHVNSAEPMRAIVDAATRMYQGGTMKGSVNTSAFRSSWEEFIFKARQKAQQQQGTLSMKSKKGIKL